MARLARTPGLSDVQQAILSTVREFVDKEIVPHAQCLEHTDTYPVEIVDGLRELGLFGLTIAEEPSAVVHDRAAQSSSSSRRRRRRRRDDEGTA